MWKKNVFPGSSPVHFTIAPLNDAATIDVHGHLVGAARHGGHHKAQIIGGQVFLARAMVRHFWGKSVGKLGKLHHFSEKHEETMCEVS